MELSRLSAIQVRLKNWLEFAQHEVTDQKLRRAIEDSAKSLSALIASCWDSGTVSSQDEAKIIDLERGLQALDEEARVHVSTRSGAAAR